MKRISRFLTNYVIDKGIVGQEDREVYEYGFTVAIEIGIFAFICIIITVCMGMYLEGILFFGVFVPLRSYAGGLHLKRYYSCLILSVLTFGGILWIARSICLPAILSDAISIVSLLGIYMLYPVENSNREVDIEENRYFRRKLIVYLITDAIIILLFNIFCLDRGIVVGSFTLLIIFLTMILGKCANLKHKPSS